MSKVTVRMQVDKECGGSRRFATNDAKAAVTNVYVSRALEGVNSASEILVTIEVPEVGKAATPTQDAALLAALK